MVEVDKTAEARRRAQRAGEEDPLIVAQRFLNIFRQLHIFSEEKKTVFNNMLLSLPPETRGMFVNLPGGGVLQDYVDELAEKAGVQKAIINHEAAVGDDEVSKAKILAKALAEAQIQAAPQVQAAAVSKDGKQIPVQTVIQGGGKVEMSDNFAREFARVVAEALKDNNNEQKEQIKLMLQGLGRTQLELIKIAQAGNEKQNSENLNLSKMLTQAQVQLAELLKELKNTPRGESAGVTAAEPSEEILKMVQMLSESQQEIRSLVEKVSQMQASGGAVIPDKVSLETGSEMLKMFEMIAQSQQQMTDVAEAIKNAPGSPATFPDKITVESSPEMLKMVEMLSESQKQITELLEKNNSQPAGEAFSGKIISEPSPEMMQMLKLMSDSQQQIAEMLEHIKDTPAVVTNSNGETVAVAAAPANNPQMNKMIKMMSESQERIAETLAKLDLSRNSSQENQELCKLFENSQNQLNGIVDAINENHRNDTAAIAKAITESQQQIAKMLLANSSGSSAPAANQNNIEYTKQMSKIADKLADVQHMNVSAMEQVIEDIVSAQSKLYRNVAETQTKELSSIISLALQESQQMLAQNLIKVFEGMPKYYPAVQSSAAPVYFGETAVPPAPEAEIIEVPEAANYNPDTETVEEPLPQQLQTEELAAAETPKKKKKKKKKRKSEDDNGVSTTSFSTAAAADSAVAEPDYMPGSEEDTAWNYVPEESPAAEDFIPAAQNEDEDFLHLDEVSADSEDNLSGGWGFSSVPEEDALSQETIQSPFNTPNQLQTEETEAETESTDGEGQDWEWDYEEVDDNGDYIENGSEADDETAAFGEEGQDWEWDYEELEDNGEEAQDESANNSNLIFQDDVYGQDDSYDFLNGDLNVMIQDSRSKEQNDDPYQNSASKH